MQVGPVNVVHMVVLGFERRPEAIPLLIGRWFNRSAVNPAISAEQNLRGVRLFSAPHRAANRLADALRALSDLVVEFLILPQVLGVVDPLPGDHSCRPF